jgi:hypothetical protein
MSAELFIRWSQMESHTAYYQLTGSSQSSVRGLFAFKSYPLAFDALPLLGNAQS